MSVQQFWQKLKYLLWTSVVGRLHSLFLRSPQLQAVYCWIELQTGSIALTVGNPYRAAEHFCRATRRVRVQARSKVLAQKRLQPFFQAGPSRILESFLRSSHSAQLRGRFASQPFPRNVTLGGSMLPLKLADLANRERGVLMLTYNFGFRAFHSMFDTEKLKDHYWIVLEPDSDRIEDIAYLLFTHCDVVIQAGNPRIRSALQTLDSPFHATKISSSDWVDSDLFRPLKDSSKTYDLIYVANWTLNKRHSLLFSALKTLPPHLKVALVGFSWERPRASLEAEMKVYGVEQQCEIFENVPAAEVNRFLNASKVNLLLSRREGGNRALYEAMFAGIPSIVVDSCEGVDTSCINEQTGTFCHEERVSEAIEYMLANTSRFSPREWALAHSGYLRSTAILNRTLQEISCAAGYRWTTEIAAKVNRPNLQYKLEADAARLEPALHHLASFLRK